VTLMIDRMFDKGALQTLERVVQFTGARNRVLVDNVANMSTPTYKPRDLSVKGFQKTLGDALRVRRGSGTPMTGRLRLRDTGELSFGEGGLLSARGGATGEGILFHDQNNRDLERTMQHLAENAMAHNTAIELLRQSLSVMEMAIRERA